MDPGAHKTGGSTAGALGESPEMNRWADPPLTQIQLAATGAGKPPAVCLRANLRRHHDEMGSIWGNECMFASNAGTRAAANQAPRPSELVAAAAAAPVQPNPRVGFPCRSPILPKFQLKTADSITARQGPHCGAQVAASWGAAPRLPGRADENRKWPAKHKGRK